MRERAARGCLGIDQHHELVLAERKRLQAPFARGKGKHAEVERAAEDFAGHLPGRDAAHLDVRVGMVRAEAFDHRQQDVYGAFVGADQHAAAPQVLQLANRALGLCAQCREALRVVEEKLARLGQPASLRGTIEQAFVQLVLEPPDGLADCRLGAVQPLRGAREAALGGDGEEDLQLGEIHGGALRDGRAWYAGAA